MKYLRLVWFELCLLVVSLVVFLPQVYAYQVPPYQGLVNDYAQVLSTEFEAQLEDELAQVASATSGAEIAVVTISTLDGEPIEDVAQEFFDTWQIGKSGSDNGVLFIAAIQDHQMRIQTGYGVEAYLTDSATGRIIRQDITPHFKVENYEAGVRAGVDSMLEAVRDPAQFAASQGDGNSPDLVAGFISTITIVTFFSLVSGLFTYIVAFLGRSKAWWPGGVAGAVLGAVTGQFLGAFLPSLVGFSILGFFLDYVLSKNYQNWKLEKKTTSWKKTWGGFSSGSSSSSSSSSGFSSFGGGSSGGGGASGSW